MSAVRVNISVPECLRVQVRLMQETGELSESVSAICQRALRQAVADARAARRNREEEGTR